MGVVFESFMNQFQEIEAVAQGHLSASDRPDCAICDGKGLFSYRTAPFVTAKAFFHKGIQE
jgi:hypothetical protein